MSSAAFVVSAPLPLSGRTVVVQAALCPVQVPVQTKSKFLVSKTNFQFSSSFEGSRSIRAVKHARVTLDSDRKAQGVRAQWQEVPMVVLPKPMGIVFEEGPDGRIYVAEVTEGGAAAKSGLVKVGDRIKATSATFGDEMWSAEGSDFGRVLAAIKTRAYDVKLVLERNT
eukprot:EC124543.1.p1 GENE.EC124543.1~~EC124543.1.p1  ORF type:complete len:169 (+),score=13.70 EC124543.1:71-577(+)